MGSVVVVVRLVQSRPAAVSSIAMHRVMMIGRSISQRFSIINFHQQPKSTSYKVSFTPTTSLWLVSRVSEGPSMPFEFFRCLDNRVEILPRPL